MYTDRTEDCVNIEQMTTMPQGSHRYKTLVFTALALGALLLLLVGAYMIGQLGVGKNTNTASTKTVADTAARRMLPSESETVFSRTGTLVGVGGSTLTVQAAIFNNATGGYANAELTVKTNGKTTYVQVDQTASRGLPVPGQQTPAATLTTMQRSVLHVGDTVQVFSAQNIKGETEFTATEVRRML